MLQRVIPNTSESLPVIGLGTWQTFDHSPSDDATMQDLSSVLHGLREAGGRVVDSSPMYGRSEEIAGTLSTQLGVNRELFVATKVWTRGRESGIRQMEESFRLLRRERIDLMQVHNLVDWRTHLATLREWKARGRVRYIGVTHYDPSSYQALEDVLRRESVDFVQLAYSVGVRDAAHRLLPLAEEQGVAVLVNRPLEGGTAFSRARATPLPDLAKAFASSWAEAFLKFALAHPAVTCVIPGTSSPDHMQDNVRAGEGRLPTPAECRD